MTIYKMKTPNALINEKSPYLLQHAYNPVNWYPWREEAFTRATEEHKPIFISIGYSTCHWCHVMARESFENVQTAERLNENFVCIKVDREERPDLDAIYMKAVQMMAGAGGWPLSVFLTPDLKPFYGGTYFPPEPGHGLPAFNDVLRTIVNLWHDKREQIEQNSEQITKHLRNSYMYKSPSEQISPDLLDNAFEQLVLQSDSDYGGFGADVAAWSAKNPKFPLPSYLAFLLRYYHRTQEKYALKMVTKTLYAMARGGIYDQLGGGFHRYSTDRYWLVPHFEKIITGWNSLMISAFALGYQVLRDRRFLDAATSATQFILNNLSKEGQLFRRYRAGEAAIHGTLEDYAFLIAALLDLYEARFDPKWLREAFQPQQSYASRNSKSKDRRSTGICSRNQPAFYA